MPELPDITIYQEALADRLTGQPLLGMKMLNPFVLRSVEPKPSDFVNRVVQGVSRVGKRLVLEFDGDRFVVVHLMIAGRLRWLEPGKSVPGKISHAAFSFPNGTLVLTEASSKKRASITLGQGREFLASIDPGGIDPLTMSRSQFQDVLLRENRTLKRALTNPHFFSGIGNAYSDEILHAARLSPLRLTQALKPEELYRLYAAIPSTLTHWTEVLRKQFAGKFPGAGDITAFRPDFAVHGKFKQPCPVCGAPVQRIAYAENEANYCAVCQNEGRLLADRALSRLLKDDWPRTLEGWD